MVVQFSKHAGKAPTLTCARDDGSSTWFNAGHNGEFFVAHDLLHFAVETTLGFSTAFYGMIAAGRDLTDFGTRGGKPDPRPYTDEAMQAEHIVGLIQVLFPPDIHPNYATFVEAYHEKSSLKLNVSQEQLLEIHEKWCDLLHQWHELGDSGYFRLKFAV
jgi:hypothetical protein